PDLYPWYEMEWLTEPRYGSKVCVLAELIKRQMVELGRDAEDIVVTGSAAFDDLADPDGPCRGQQWRASKGIKETDRVVLFASQPHPNPVYGSHLALELAEKAKVDRSWKLVVRPHPNERFLSED